MIENDSKLRLAQRSAGPDQSEAAPVAGDGAAGSPLSQLRLLTVLDALLATGSVSTAAAALNLSPAAVSRTLGQLRLLFGDALMVRSGRGLVPTARAEALRPRLRALVFEAEQLISGKPARRAPAGNDALPVSDLPLAPLALRPAAALDGAPDILEILARKLPQDRSVAPELRLARHVSTVGAGAGQSRTLDRAEAEDAFSILFDGRAHPVQTGALLVAMQMRGITAPELAGMVAAARRALPPLGHGGPVDLDWPAYLSPRNRRPPWFLLAARLIADAGYRVLLHGQEAGLLPYFQILEPLGIPVAGSLAEARGLLAARRCVFLPLPALHSDLAGLMQTYRLFEMRSPLLLGRQLLNPAAAPATIIGPPSANQMSLHLETAAILGQPALICLENHRDVAQATPNRFMRVTLMQEGRQQAFVVSPSTLRGPDPVPAELSSSDYALGLWSGTQRDAGALATVLDTAAAALIAMGEAPADMGAARALAADLWQSRRIR